MYDTAGNGWPHKALQYHQLTPINLHFQDFNLRPGLSSWYKQYYYKCLYLFSQLLLQSTATFAVVILHTFVLSVRDIHEFWQNGWSYIMRFLYPGGLGQWTWDIPKKFSCFKHNVAIALQSLAIVPMWCLWHECIATKQVILRSCDFHWKVAQCLMIMCVQFDDKIWRVSLKTIRLA